MRATFFPPRGLRIRPGILASDAPERRDLAGRHRPRWRGRDAALTAIVLIATAGLARWSKDRYGARISRSCRGRVGRAGRRGLLPPGSSLRPWSMKDSRILRTERRARSAPSSRTVGRPRRRHPGPADTCGGPLDPAAHAHLDHVAAAFPGVGRAVARGSSSAPRMVIAASAIPRVSTDCRMRWKPACARPATPGYHGRMPPAKTGIPRFDTDRSGRWIRPLAGRRRLPLGEGFLQDLQQTSGIDSQLIRSEQAGLAAGPGGQVPWAAGENRAASPRRPELG